MTTSPSAEEGDLLDRGTFAVRAEGGGLLGTAVLIEPQRALTCAHVVEGLDRVEIALHPDADKLCAATVERRGNPDGPDDLALLLLDSERSGLNPIPFVDWQRGESFATIGFPAGKRPIQGKVLGVSDVHGWLEIGSTGTRKIKKGFSGGAVWVLSRKAAVGLITHYAEDGVAYAITTRQILDFHPIGWDGSDPWKRCAGQVARLRKRLAKVAAREAIQEANEKWEDAGEDEEALARTLCLETEPVDLAQGLCGVYCTLLGAQRSETAADVFEVLMDALPVSLISRWRLEAPEATATQVELGLRDWVLAELVLAVTDGGSARFELEPDHKDSDTPRATYRLPRPGELGGDPKAEEGAEEIAKEVRQRLALGLDGTPESLKGAADYMAYLATRRHPEGGHRLLDRAYLERTKDAYEADRAAFRGALLQEVNERLRLGAFGLLRKLYFGAGQSDEALVDGLREHLPQLRLVTQDLSRQQHEDVERVLYALTQAFSRRRAFESERSPL